MFILSVQTSWCRKTQTRYLHDNMLVWYTSDSGDTEDKDWRTQSISAPILSSEAGNWGEKTRRRVGSVQFAPKLCLALVVVNNFDINVHGFHNIWRKILSFLALWHLWIYQQDTMLTLSPSEMWMLVGKVNIWWLQTSLLPKMPLAGQFNVRFLLATHVTMFSIVSY